MQLNVVNTIKKNRSLIYLFIIVLIPIVTLSYFLLYDSYINRLNEEKNKNEQLAKVMAQNLDNFIANTKSTLFGLSTLEAFKAQNTHAIEKTFEGLSKGQSEVVLYWITDDKGNVIDKYPDIVPSKSAAGKEFFIRAMQGSTYVSDRVIGDMLGKELIFISVPYRDTYGNILGAIGASITLDKLQDKLKMKVGTAGYPILVSKAGSFLAHPQLEQVRKKVIDGDPIWQALRQGSSGTLDSVAPFDGKRKLFSYVPMKEAEWVVVVIQPLEEFQGQINQLFERNTLVLILVLAIVILAAYYFILARNKEEAKRTQKAEKLALVGQLAAGMAHEIRNPLTCIKGFVQMIDADEGKIAHPSYIQTILKEVSQIENIISETLVLAKPSPTNFTTANLNEIISEVIELMQPQLNVHSIEIKLSSPDKIPLIEVEPNHMKQVFVNLVKNAIESMSESGGLINIEIRLYGSNLRITIADMGKGIPKHHLDKLGSPFFTTKDEGTGLGLMVSYRIIQNHGGTIDVFSVQGKGTTFQITLPLKQKI